MNPQLLSGSEKQGQRGIVAKMGPDFFHRLRRVGIAFAACGLASLAAAEPRHGIAMYGDPALPPDFVSLPYANPAAPKGGADCFRRNGGVRLTQPARAFRARLRGNCASWFTSL